MRARRQGLTALLWGAAVAFVALTGVLVARGFAHFRRFGIERDTVPYVVELGECLAESFGRPWMTAWTRRPGPLRVFHIDASPELLAALDDDPPYSGRAPIPAALRVGDRRLDVEIRRRGDTYGHWGRAKRSLRVRTAETQPFEGMRTFHLMAPELPEQLNDALGFALARRLGLLAPRAELVQVMLRGEDHGLHVLVEHCDEGLLRRNRRLSGPIYEGDLIGSTAWTGVPNELFSAPGLWSIGNRDGRSRRDCEPQLAELIGVIGRPMDEASAQRLAEIVDLEAFARLSIVEQLTQTNHLDTFHNWLLVWDEARRCFEPIVWDLNGWERSMCPSPGTPLDFHPVVTPLTRRLHQLVPFLDARDRALAGFIERGGPEWLLGVLDDMVSASADVSSGDPLRTPRSEAELVAARVDFRARVVRLLDECARDREAGKRLASWSPSVGRADGVVLRVDGVVPLRGLRILLRRASSATAVSIALASDGERQPFDLGGRWSMEGRCIEIDVVLVAELETQLGFRAPEVMRNHRCRPRPTDWELRLVGLDADAIEAITAFDGQSVPRGERRPMRPAGDLFLGWPAAAPTPLVLSGTIDVERTMTFDGPVEIAPGTVFRLAPDCGLLFRNRVLAEGTRAEPIRFERAAQGSAWGGIAIEGRRADGSRLRWIEMSGGSGFEAERDAFPAMLTVQNVRGVAIVDSRVRAASIADDAIHAICADLWLERITVEDASSDGIDCDRSRLVMLASRVSRCGNDCVDLMASDAVIEGCVLESAGDKAVSAGEASRCLVAASVLGASACGIESRDGTLASVLSSAILDVRVAFAARVKDSRYGAGGRLGAMDCLAMPPTQSADPDSSLSVVRRNR